MKHLLLQTPVYRLYIHRLEAWLSTLGYSASMVKRHPVLLQEFFHYCEKRSVNQIEDMTAEIINGYIEYIKTRKSYGKEGALSYSQINSHIRTLHLFALYLRKTENSSITVPVRLVREEKKIDHVILSLEQIKQLYAATDTTPYGLRDRAMLAVYYGCGLRKSEGLNLDVSDVLFERRLLYIRKAKNNHERYVPITKSHLHCLEQWILGGRDLLLCEQGAHAALFISERGRRISDGTMYMRLKALQHKAGIEKEIGLHTLRHSLATHLLQKGMPLENIALLLGHRCLDSTQLYTHILNETLC